MNELKLFTDQVEKMRHAQTRYFELIGKAKKTHTPEDYKTANDTLTISKHLEKDVDEAIMRMRKVYASIS